MPFYLRSIFKYVRSFKFLLAFVLFFVLTSKATLSAQSISLFDAVQSACNNYPLLKQIEAQCNQFKAHIRTVVNNNRLPALKIMEEGTLGTSNSLPGGYFSMGIVPSASGSIRPAEKTALASGNIAVSYLDWQFYTFGYYKAQNNEATAQFNTQLAAYEAEKYLLTGNVVQLYLDLLKKYKLWTIEKENVHRIEAITLAIKANVNSGLKAGVDSATANAVFANAKVAMLQAENDFVNDRLSFITLSGNAFSSFIPDTSLLLQGKFQSLLKNINQDSLAQTNPLLLLPQSQLSLQLAEQKSISKKYLPHFALEGAGWFRGTSISNSDVYSSNLANAMLYSRYNYLMGLTISYNLTDIIHRKNEMAEQHYKIKAQEENLAYNQLMLQTMLAQARNNFNLNKNMLLELPFALQSGQDAYIQQMALYQSGLNTLIDVTNALFELKQEQTKLLLAQVDYLKTLFLLAGYTNNLNGFLENCKN
jgi:outer membrane protein TolC